MEDLERVLFEQQLAELDDVEFEEIVARTRPPRLNPQQRATEALRREVRGHAVD